MTKEDEMEQRLKWHVGDNLRWLADRSDRPDYMPCGMLTGAFLISVADSYEQKAAALTSTGSNRLSLGVEERENDYARCPVCGAPPGLHCRTIQGPTQPHPERLSLDRALSGQSGEALDHQHG